MSPKRTGVETRRWLHVLDSVLAIFLFAPIVVGYWRGTWQLFEYYMFPDDLGTSAWLSLIVGLSSTCIFSLLQDHLTEYVCPRRGRLPYVLGSRLYTTLFACGVVNHWRGAWEVFTHYTGTSWESAASSTIIGAVLLASMRTLRNIIAPPFIVVVDCYDDFYRIRTMFGVKRRKKPCLFVLDVLFSIIVVGSLVVFVWRGSWLLLDIFLFPEDESWSAWGSFSLGLSVVLISYPLQLFAKWFSKRLGKLTRIIFEDIFIFFANFGAINIWRGVWMLLNIYLLPDQPVLSNWLTHAVGLIALMCLYNGNSILVRGVYIDGELTDGTGCLFQVAYFRKLCKKQLKKSPTPFQERRVSFDQLLRLIGHQDSAINKYIKTNKKSEPLEEQLNATDIPKNNSVHGAAASALLDGRARSEGEQEIPETIV